MRVVAELSRLELSGANGRWLHGGEWSESYLVNRQHVSEHASLGQNVLWVKR